MKSALERHDQGKACVIPILLRPVNWQETAFSKLQVLPQGAVPVTLWPSRDEAFSNIAMSIEKTVKEFSHPDQSPKPSQQTDSQAKQTFSQQRTWHSAFPQAASPNTLLTSGVFPPSSTTPIPAFAQWEDEMFEEYILKKIRENNIPSTWRIFQTARSKIIICGLFFGVTFFALYIMVNLFIPLVFADITAHNTVNFSFFLWQLLIGAVLGSLTYGANWLYWFLTKKTLVLTPNGFIYFKQRSSRHVVKFRVVRSISFKTCDSDLLLFITDKILTVNTNLLTIEIKLNSFATPETIAQHIDDAYTLFKTNHDGAMRSAAFP